MASIAVDEAFVETFRTELVGGRNLSPDDPGAILLNETAVRQLGWDDPIGKRFGLHDREATVIEVVRDFHLRSLHESIEPVFLHVSPSRFAYLAVRIAALRDFRETLGFLEEAWGQFIPDHSVNWFFLTHGIWNKKYRAEVRFSQVANAFSLLAIFVACLGLFGLASFVTEQRTKEIGIRKVVGASASSITLLLSGDYAKIVIAASLVAWPVGHYVVGKWLQQFAYRIEPGIGIFVLALTATLAIALLTVGWQTVRAAHKNPVDALRYE
jgi:putative ABC transport system permease protein